MTALVIVLLLVVWAGYAVHRISTSCERIALSRADVSRQDVALALREQAITRTLTEATETVAIAAAATQRIDAIERALATHDARIAAVQTRRTA